jgi:DNA-binding transcriptional regulator YdaS (Cro superfamily)
MPNNVGMTDHEIIQLLGGPTAVANLLSIKPPSVHEWIKLGIPESRLRELAGHLEKVSEGRFSRRERWPDKYMFYWPELAQAPDKSAQGAIETVAGCGNA